MKTADQLKQYFVTGGFPTQQNFSDLIDFVAANAGTIPMTQVTDLVTTLDGLSRRIDNVASPVGGTKLKVYGGAASYQLPTGANLLMVFVGGFFYSEGDDYSIDQNNQITFIEATTVSTVINFIYN